MLANAEKVVRKPSDAALRRAPSLTPETTNEAARVYGDDTRRASTELLPTEPVEPTLLGADDLIDGDAAFKEKPPSIVQL